MNKIIHLSLYIASLTMLPAYALDETDEQNMTGATVKVLNKYQGRWKGWSDGCVNCDKPLVLEEPLAVKNALVAKKRGANTGTKKKIKSKSMAKESKGSNQNTEKKAKKVQPMRKSLRRGYCGCNCENNDSSGRESSKDTKCNDVNNHDTLLRPESALDSEPENKHNEGDSEKANNKKSFNMDVRDTPRPSNNNTTGTKDSKGEKGESEKKEIGTTGNDGVDSSDNTTNNDMNEKAKEKSKFSIFSIWD